MYFTERDVTVYEQRRMDLTREAEELRLGQLDRRYRRKAGESVPRYGARAARYALTALAALFVRN